MCRARGLVGDAVWARTQEGLEALRTEALTTLLAIAPDDEAALRLLLDGLFAEDLGVRLAAHRILEARRSDAALAARVIAVAEARLAAASSEEKVAIAAAVGIVAASAPDVAERLLVALLEPDDAPSAWTAMHALVALADRLGEGTLATVVRTIERDAPPTEPALKLLGTRARGGKTSAAAQAAVLGVLRHYAGEVPVGGPKGGRSRTFARATEVAAVLLPKSDEARRDEALGHALAWLGRAPSARYGANDVIGWYELRDALEGAVALDAASAELRTVMVRLARFAAKASSRDRWAAQDFVRAVARAARAMGDPPELWKELAAAKVPREPVASGDGPREGAVALPPLPSLPPLGPALAIEAFVEAGSRSGPAPTAPRSASPAAPVATKLPAAAARTLRAESARGAVLAHVAIDAPPAEVAEAVDAAFTKARARKRPMSLVDASALGALWGDALARATGWSWARVRVGRATSECVVSPDRAYACAPLEYGAAQRVNEVTALLLFNMIVDGALPPSLPGMLARLG